VPVPDFSDPRAPYVQIADHLRGQIEAGRYRPGDKLPSISALVAEYGSATETVRRALGVLRTQGLVETHSTRGTFVLKPSGEAARDPDVARLEAALAEAEQRLGQRIDDLRDEVEFMQAELMALGGAAPGQRASRDRDVGT